MMMLKLETQTVFFGWLWNKFRSSQPWRLLRGIPLLRSGLYFAIETLRALREGRLSSVEMIDGDFTRSNDPWRYETSPLEQERFLKQTELLDEVRGNQLFESALEIGCAEGLYTEVLAERCESLLVLDLSPTALARTQCRRAWSERVRFCAFDLKNQAIPGKFELIVIAGVLEYFSNPLTFFRIRKRLIAAVRPNGYLLVETTRASPVVEDALWARFLIRGKWINAFISKHSSLSVVASAMTDRYLITLYRRTEPINTQ